MIKHDPRTCDNSKPCFDCEYPNVKQKEQTTINEFIAKENQITYKGYKIEVARDVFAEAQPEHTTADPLYCVNIYGQDNGLIDLATGFDSEQEAINSAKGQIDIITR